MAEIQMTPTWPLRPEMPPGTAVVEGDPGFALMPPDLLPAWAGMPGGPGTEAMAPDPVTLWLEGILGLTADFVAPPAADPNVSAPEAPVFPPEPDMVPSDKALPVGILPVAVDVMEEPAAPELPARPEVVPAPAPPAAQPGKKGGNDAASQGGADQPPVAVAVAVAGSAPQTLPAFALPRMARDPGRALAALPVAPPAPPLATTQTTGAGPGQSADIDPPISVALHPARPLVRGPVAAEQDVPAGRGPDLGFARPVQTDPAQGTAARTGLAEPQAADPAPPKPTDAADAARIAPDSGAAFRTTGPPPSGPLDMLPGPDARPIPEFRMAEMARPPLPTAPGGPEVASDPRPVLRQITDAVVTTRGDRTEITLAPEELGRIRMVLSGPERGQITLWAERPDTLDLVRRNADLLTQQLAEAGVTADSLDFRQDDRRNGSAAQPRDPADADEAQTAPPALRVSLAPAPLSDRRIDIRL
ncbi:hypothetical protein FA743_06355 [Paracoccus gahaiensis]|uniref:Flagellar hook-length control protein-like C-terminal domain-containing protein n=1 Tax=Paracoccus gahaiensis TaxID=1706839 RepID=A0A4U0RBN9_9RHOB|nr:flagellar hook-length control protein FliK [Paracoccus gahaiensis]TJZ92487.1 hypothetical protein FA743_06355 [Paracoccus gahaiensis]